MRQGDSKAGQITLSSYRRARAKYLAGLDRAHLLTEMHHGIQQFINFGQPEIAGLARKLYSAIKANPAPSQLAEQFTRLEVGFILTPKTRNLLQLPPFKGQAARRHGQGIAGNGGKA